MALKRIMGIAGVPLNAPYKAQRWGKYFEHGLIFIFILLLWRWYLEQNNAIPLIVIKITSWVVWGYFVAELAVCSFLVEDKRHYLLINWLNWIIIVFGFPLFIFHSAYFSLIRLLKIFLLIRFGKGYLEASINMLAKRYWLSTMFVLLSIVLLSALILSFIDPAFKNIGDGLWFAWESMTTVGYGDYVPHTTVGKIFSSIIIILGVTLISMMTASFAALIINKDDEQLNIQNELDLIKKQLSRIEEKLTNTENKQS